jgi:hypothetical protein
MTIHDWFTFISGMAWGCIASGGILTLTYQREMNSYREWMRKRIESHQAKEDLADWWKQPKEDES